MRGPMSRVETVFRKESKELWSNRPLVYSFLDLVLFFVLVPVLLLFVIGSFSPEEAQSAETSPAVKQLARLVPGLEEMPPAEQAAIVVVRHFILIFLVLPVIGALGSSTSSIVGEKQSRSMEPVLATPVTTLELLAGKSLATVSLAVFGTWSGFLVYAILGRWIIHSVQRPGSDKPDDGVLADTPDCPPGSGCRRCDLEPGQRLPVCPADRRAARPADRHGHRRADDGTVRSGTRSHCGGSHRAHLSRPGSDGAGNSGFRSRKDHLGVEVREDWLPVTGYRFLATSFQLPARTTSNW